MPAMNRKNIQQITLRLPKSKVKWMDRYAKDMGLSRNQLIEKIITSIQTASTDIDQQGTFLNLMKLELEDAVERAHQKASK